jgi:rare lipoprotein A
VRRVALGLVVAGTVLAAGCGTVPREPAPVVQGTAPPPVAEPPPPVVAPKPPPRPAARAPAPAPRASRPRGGAYYQDDGPDESPPAGLDAVPDAVPRAEPLHPSANRPYRVFGRPYVPRTELTAHRERGHASWYGRKFHGRPTSSGERYDMYAMSAAHPTLPIPSYVRVTHLGNGRSVVVRVNDRGPFLRQRVIDLSYAAAHRLGYVHVGSAEVEVELLQPPGGRPLQTAVRADVASGPDAPRPAAPELPMPMLAEAALEQLLVELTSDDRPQAAGGSAAVWLQLGAFSARDGAEAARARYARELPWLPVPIEVVRAGALWRVQAGPWQRRDDAARAAERIGATGGVRPVALVR